MKNILLYPIWIGIVLYRFLTRKCYYITGTGLNAITGERMWFKVCFHTYGSVLPIKSIEENTKREMGLKTCVVLNWNRLPLSMVKYVDKDYDLRFEVRPVL